MSQTEKVLKAVPALDFRADCETVYTIQYDKKQDVFTLFRRKKITHINEKSACKVIALDPGVRTLLTGITRKSIVEIGVGVGDHIRNIYKKIESIKQCNVKKNTDDKSMSTMKRGVLNRSRRDKISRLETKIKNYVNDTQWKTALFLAKYYDHVVIGSFSTSNMSKKKVGVMNLRVMKSLNMYQLREKIKYKCMIYKRKYLRVNEAYTTKLCSKCGEYNDVGGSKIYTCTKCNYQCDRDVKSACCILMKSLL